MSNFVVDNKLYSITASQARGAGLRDSIALLVSIGIKFKCNTLASFASKNLHLDSPSIFGYGLLVEPRHEMEVSCLNPRIPGRIGRTSISPFVVWLIQGSDHDACRAGIGIDAPR